MNKSSPHSHDFPGVLLEHICLWILKYIFCIDVHKKICQEIEKKLFPWTRCNWLIWLMMSLFSLKLIHTSNYFSKIVNSNLSVQFLFIDKTDSLEVLVVVIGLSQSQAPSMNQWSYCCCCTDKWWPRWSLFWVTTSDKSHYD